MPFGFSGVFNGAALVFFCFLGFDAVAMAAEEVENPKKDVPWELSVQLRSLPYCISWSRLILTGIVPLYRIECQ